MELFNNHYIHILEKTSGIAPKCIGNPGNPNLDESTVVDIINKYKYHPSTTKIKELDINKTSFEFPEATMEDINKTITKLSPNKATGPDHIPKKVIKAPPNIIDSNLTYVVNKGRKTNKYSEDAKTVLVRPIYKFTRDSYKTAYQNFLTKSSQNSDQLIENLTLLSCANETH